jgi:transcriptional regulator with PAS, ATPase and Fis domain
LRVIAATNRNLEEAVHQGKFREDLYYRLNVLPIALPPLRAHPDDIPILAKYYIDAFNREFRKKVTAISPAALETLQHYHWPGNIRELRNAVERAMLLTDSNVLLPEHFPMARVSAASAGLFELPTGGVNLEELERDLVRQALARTGGNQTKAAALLGLNRDQIRYRVEKFGAKT